MLSFGHIRLALRNTACSQLNLMLSPASVSCGRTWWIYTSASRSSFSLGGADALSRSSEFLRFIRPTESGTRCSPAVNRSFRFIALTMASLSSCVPAPTCEPAPAGPHCFGGGALVDVRRPWPGFVRLRVFPESPGVPSLEDGSGNTLDCRQRVPPESRECLRGRFRGRGAGRSLEGRRRGGSDVQTRGGSAACACIWGRRCVPRG